MDNTREAWSYVRERCAELRSRRQAEIAQVPTALSDLYARRWSRVVAGKIAVIGALMVAASGVVGGIIARNSPSSGITPRWSTPLLFGALAAWLFGYLAARAWAAGRLRRILQNQICERSVHPDPFIEAEQLEREHPVSRATEQIEALGLESARWPLFGAAALLPIGIHLTVYSLVLLGKGTLEALGEFDVWIWISLIVTLPAHVTLLWQSNKFARGIFDQNRIKRLTPWRAVGWTSLAGLIPGVVVVLPPLLIAVTGLLFIPLTFWSVHNTVLGEQRELRS